MKGKAMPEKTFEVFVDGSMNFITDERQKAEAMGRFLLEQNPESRIAIREWIFCNETVLQ